jgi:hypothetical protein
MGIDMALSVQIIEEWDRIFAKSAAKATSREPSKARDGAKNR